MWGLISVGANLLVKSAGLLSSASIVRSTSVVVGKSLSTTSVQPPKKPLSGYMRFVKQQQPVVVRQYPDVSVVEVVRKIAQQWRMLTPEQKKPFDEASVAARKQYKVEMAKFQAQLTPAQSAALKEEKRQKIAKRKVIRQKRELTMLGKPKRPRIAFNIFMAEHFAEARGMTMQAKMKSLREDWKKMYPSQKQVYNQLAEDDKIRYENEMKSWEEHMIEIGRGDLIRFRKKKETAKKTVSTKGGKKKSKAKLAKTKVATKSSGRKTSISTKAKTTARAVKKAEK
ncbi:transcription factor A, mitochondrial isoform X2 [Megalops cyprinoides]|uniref:transcription factor A, mitochondrial isoform X2 n=1 Tax=Megalops cyprinoides TaxID=118141 RepID=UPI001864F56D|nr:transcription factor A, mitochondrial isoform X2 [Megalops cyprinoides]